MDKKKTLSKCKELMRSIEDYLAQNIDEMESETLDFIFEHLNKIEIHLWVNDE